MYMGAYPKKCLYDEIKYIIGAWHHKWTIPLKSPRHVDNFTPFKHRPLHMDFLVNLSFYGAWHHKMAS